MNNNRWLCRAGSLNQCVAIKNINNNRFYANGFEIGGVSRGPSCTDYTPAVRKQELAKHSAYCSTCTGDEDVFI